MSNDTKKDVSRTLRMCWGILLIATGLVVAGIITGAHWVTVTGTVLIAWQARRYGDNVLKSNGGGK